ncbi:MXAN_6230/SCO0854 family RING domain-containing protein, partial [Streptomyces sp. NPDC002586]
VLTLLLQAPEQPCVLCGTNGTVQAVSPCAHLVCRSCFEGSDYSACPICNRTIDADDPFLRPASPRIAASTRRALPQRLRVLSHGGDPTARTADAAGELSTLLARTGALSPQETEDLMVLLDEAGDRSNVDWLPDVIPGRETKARVLSWLLADKDTYTATLPAVTARITTATDVLRLLVVLSGGDAGLVETPRFTAVPRALRRALLTALDGLDPVLVTEDMQRYPAAWKHGAERLHPFEYAHRYPRAALAFAALREFLLTEDALSQTLRTAARHTTATTLDAGAVSLPVWTSQVEAALADTQVERAALLLAQRPGAFVRRLDHMLRLAGPDSAEAVLTALAKTVYQVSPAVLLSALGAIRTRSRKGISRVFFPKGSDARAHIVPDERAPLATAVIDRTVSILTGEVLRRAAKLAPADIAVIDAGLDGLIAPFAERTASRSLVTLPRGSELPIPPGRTVRLFVHWMESATSGRTDLDLSAALFNKGWEHIGTCDYTSYRHFDGAVHSGDRTSAPAPEGASEFIDLDLDKLAARGVRYVVGTVFSYNGVPFDQLDDAFAGVMVRDEPGEAGPVFDARQVEQRFDLTSKARASLPLLIDVNDRTMRWLDVV